MVDYVTKWIEAVAMKDQTAASTADAIYRWWICRHGLFRRLHSDNAKNFAGRVLKVLARYLGYEHTFSPTYHPQSNPAERPNRWLGDALTAYIDANHTNWDLMLEPILFAYRTSIHAGLADTPFFMTYLRDARLPADILTGDAIGPARRRPATIPSSVRALATAYEVVREHMAQRRHRQQLRYNAAAQPLVLDEGMVVMVYYVEQARTGESTKFVSRWIGPYRITDRLGDCLFRVRHINTDEELTVHVSRLRLFRPWVTTYTPDPKRLSATKAHAIDDFIML